MLFALVLHLWTTLNFHATSASATATTNTKGLITRWISARAEISLRPPGWNIVAITWSISARAQNANFREKVYWGAKAQ